MLRFLSFFTILIYSFYLLKFVKCDCLIKYNNDELSNKPLFTKDFGSKHFKIPYWEQEISFFEKEKIFGYCATKFTSFETEYKYLGGYYKNQLMTEYKLYEEDNSAILTCKDNKIYYEDGNPLRNEKLMCSDLMWGLYEGFEQIFWCEQDDMSYIMQTKNLDTNLILGVACYNVKNRSLSSLLYTIGPNINNFDHNNLRFWATSDDLNKNKKNEVLNYKGVFQYFNSLNDDLLQLKLSDAALENPYLQFATYNYKPIVSEEPFMNYFKEYHLLLDTIWWKNLQMGNWKRFIDVMNQRAQNFTYYMYIGNSGALEIPIQNNCRQQNSQRSTIKFELNKSNKTIPTYIWNYVEASDGTDEFVFIGYNSPFYEFFEENEIIFCKDICSNIPWLKDIQKTFRYSVMGISFCCSVDEIRAGNLLDGFPKQKFTISLTTTTTTTTTTPTPIISTTYTDYIDSSANTIPTNNLEEDSDGIYFDN